MIHLPHWIPVYLFRPLGWVVLHSLWQVALVVLLYRGLAMLTEQRSPRFRYAFGWAALLACLVLPAATFRTLSAVPTAPRDPSSAGAAVAAHRHGAGEGAVSWSGAAAGGETSGAGAAARQPVAAPPDRAALAQPAADPFGAAIAAADPWMPWLLALWASGALVGLARLVGAWWRATRLARRDTWAAPDTQQELLGRLRRRLRVAGAVRLCRSEVIDSPALIGWWRPTILLPSGAAGLSARAIEPVLAHELAHVRRRDYAANLVQSAIERFFFFHPLLHWLSRQVRIERELCCDDLAVRACEGGALAYARGLASLEALRVGAPVLAANEGNLLARIRRLVEPGHAPRRRSALALVLLAGWVMLAGATGDLLSRSEAATVLDGLDPVHLVAGDRVAGRARLAVEWAGYRYLFVDAASRAMFLAEPRRYAVHNVAVCPISGRRVRADIYRVVDGHILLFCCPEVGDLETNRRLADAVLRAALAGN